METSYWARWACNGQVSDLHRLMLPHILAEGYDLLACKEDRRPFDHGGVMRRTRWSLNGGRWQNAPIDLTITYSCSPVRTIANFYWRLGARPLPATPREKAGFEMHLQQQMNRIIASLNEQVALPPAEEDLEVAEEGATLQACWEYGYDTLPETPPPAKADRPDAVGRQEVSTVDLVAERARIRHSRMQPEAGIHCDECGSPAVPVPGTTDRYYCLICKHHLPRQTAAR